MDKINEYWKKFIEKNNLDKDIKFFEAFHFCFTKESANELLELVLQGKKKATTSRFDTEQNMPKIGDYSIVTNFDGEPFCVIKTTKTIVLPFKDIDFELCKKEGEDENLISWRNNHEKFFTAEGKMLGYKFSYDMPVVFEEFEVVHK